jgi:hypothetical protein
MGPRRLALAQHPDLLVQVASPHAASLLGRARLGLSKSEARQIAGRFGEEQWMSFDLHGHPEDAALRHEQVLAKGRALHACQECLLGRTIVRSKFWAATRLTCIDPVQCKSLPKENSISGGPNMARQKLRVGYAFAVLFASYFVLGAPRTAEATFDDRALKGSYTFVFEGNISFIDGQPQLLPVWGVGRLRADGQGSVSEADVTINVGGCVILRQSGFGEYTVERNGTGSGELSLATDAVEPVGATNDPCPSRDGGLVEEQISIPFDFAISDDGFEFIGLGFADAQGNPTAAFGSHGYGRSQE